jgi:hypothetical protein
MSGFAIEQILIFCQYLVFVKLETNAIGIFVVSAQLFPKIGRQTIFGPPEF